MKIAGAFAVALALGLAGCGECEKEKHTEKTVSHYLAHKDEIEKDWRECVDKYGIGGFMGNPPHCGAVDRARSQAHLSFK
jgi:hypothetical protein